MTTVTTPQVTAPGYQGPLETSSPGIRLTLPYPISANRYWAHRVVKIAGRWAAMTYTTPEARAYKQQVALIARAAGIRQQLTGRLLLMVDLYPHRPLDWEKRARKLGEDWDDSVQCIDLGNCEKVLSDALQGSVIENDRSFRRIELERREPDGEARVVVTVRPIVVRRAQADLLEVASA